MNIRKYIVLLLLAVVPMASRATTKGLKFFYRLGERVDYYLLQHMDTNYITLPEHSWRIAFTATTDGINSYYQTKDLETGCKIALATRSTPSIDLGFYVGYRSLGFSYSWDPLGAYDNNLQFSFGSKALGIDFQRQISTNFSGKVYDVSEPAMPIVKFPKGLLRIKNINLTAWYALNASHYSHNAAIKQSYIQKRTAGSLLLSLSYLSANMSLRDSFEYGSITQAYLVDSVKRVVSHQIAVGLGYGINITPNQGKVLIHLSANAQLVCYSINQMSFMMDDSISRVLRAEPLYNVKASFPVHVTGNVRAAVSWEINKWVHLSLWAKATNIRFTSHKDDLADVHMRNWNWQVHLNVGVRLGAGKKRVREALADEPIQTPHAPVYPSKLPKWITDFFYSPRF